MLKISGDAMDESIVAAARMLPGVDSAQLSDGVLAVKLADGTRPHALVAMLVEKGVGIAEVRRDRQSLEEAFLELVTEDAPAARGTRP